MTWLLLLAGCGQTAPVTNLPVPPVPQRVISLAPSLTEMVYELGADAHLAGVTDYCTAYNARDRHARVGTLLNPNLERIIELQPDLILAHGGTNRERTLAQLRELGLRVELFGEDTSVASIVAKYQRVAELLGRSETANGQLAVMQDSLAAVAAAVAGRPPVRVLCQVGTDPLVAVGGGSFLNELISIAGGNNLTAGAGSIYPRYSREEAIRLDPEVIIMVDMGNMSEAEVTRWRSFGSVAAARNNRLHMMEAQQICIPTPRHVVNGVRLLAGLLHPEVTLP